MEGHGRLKLFPTICLPSPPSFGANGFPGGQTVSTVADRRVGGQKRTVVDHGRFLALELTGYPTPAPRAKLGQLQVRSGPLVAHIHGSGRAPTLTQPCPRSLLLRLLDPAATLPIPAKSSTAAPQPLCSPWGKVQPLSRGKWGREESLSWVHLQPQAQRLVKARRADLP